MNFLLNFDNAEEHIPIYMRPKARKAWSSQMTQEEYVHANFQFIVLPQEKHKAHISDPEKTIHWEDVLMVGLPFPRWSAG